MEITKAKNFDTNGVAEFESVDEERNLKTGTMDICLVAKKYIIHGL